MSSTLYEKTNYLAPYDYIISSVIYEYDISKANISILFKYNAIDEATYTYLYNSDRETRQVTIGKMIRDNINLGEILRNGIMEARKAFFYYNNIEDYEVLSIKNDAIYLIGREASILNCDGILFVKKNTYTSFYKLKNKEYYYLLDRVNGIEVLDIKGISIDKVLLHEKYFIDFLKELFLSAQVYDIKDTIGTLNGFYDMYTNLELPLEFYRRLDGDSRFDIKKMFMYDTIYRADFLNEHNKKDIDISYNLSILSELQKIYAGIYFQRNRM